MSREQKVQIVNELAEIFSNCRVGILTDYRGLTTPEITLLRRKLGGAGVGIRVAKNTLAKFAAERADNAELSQFLEGPVAIVFGYDDEIEPVRALVDYIRSTKINLAIKGGFLGKQSISAQEVTDLATIPSHEVLIAKLLWGIQAPLVTLVNQLIVPIRGVINVLQARIKQIEGAYDGGDERNKGKSN